MKYLCKKAYNENFIVGKYYYSDNNIHSDNMSYRNINYNYKYILINSTKFILDNNTIIDPKLYEYFSNIQELRKLKLKKLYEISM